MVRSKNSPNTRLPTRLKQAAMNLKDVTDDKIDTLLKTTFNMVNHTHFEETLKFMFITKTHNMKCSET